MAEAGLTYKIGADVDNFESGIKKVNKGFDDMGKKSVTTVTALNKFGNSTQSATFALTNLGRVAQDLPFGFVGIANNLNPLLESFQRLQTESGGTKNAIKSILSSLVGAGGIGLALSAVTAAVTFAQIGFQAWSKVLGRSSKAADDSKDSIDKYNESLRSTVSQISDEATKVSVLVTALKGDTLARKEKIGAIEELKRINPEYFGQLKDEEGLINKLSFAYIAYIQNLKNQFAAKALDKQISELFNKKLQLEIDLTPNVSSAASKETTKAIARLQNQLDKLTGGKGIDLTKPIDQLTEADNKAIDIQRQITKLKNIPLFDLTNTRGDLKKVDDEIDALLKRRAEFENFSITPDRTRDKNPDDELKKLLQAQKEELEKQKKDLEDQASRVSIISDKWLTLNQNIAEVSKTIAGVDSKIKLVGVKDTRVRDQILKNLSEEIKIIQRKANELPSIQLEAKIAAGKIDFDSVFDIDVAEASRRFAELLKKIKQTGFEEAAKTQGRVSPLGDFNKLMSESLKQQLAAFQLLQENAINVANIVGGPVSDAFGNLFEKIATDGKISISDLGDALKGLVKQLIAAAIKAAVFAAIFSAIVPGGGSFGANFLKGLGFKLPGFAEGGVVPPGYPNDSFPARLTSGEVILPEKKLRAMMEGISGGGDTQIVVQGDLSYDRLSFRLAQNARRKTRINGL